MLLLLFKSRNETSVLDGVVQLKRLGLATYPICCPEKKVRGELDKSSWLGEIMRRIKLRAKTKYEISLPLQNVS